MAEGVRKSSDAIEGWSRRSAIPFSGPTPPSPSAPLRSSPSQDINLTTHR